ncbi:MAG: hypothetical protein M1830_002537 [Pleopsidium flavum]|nr:MAG: hypothetical protein M1830_002537 [Pleopsidium flavum]
MATVTLDPVPVRPYLSLSATISVARLVQEFRRRLKARVLRHKRVLDAPHRRTFKRRARSEFHDVFKRHCQPRVCIGGSRLSDDDGDQDLSFKELLEELDKETRALKDPLSKTAANENLFLHHDLRFDAKAIGLCELARSFDIVTAFLARLSHRPGHAGPITSGKEIVPSDLDDEKFIANLEHLLRRLQYILFDLLIKKLIELLIIEALYWQKHLDDGIFAEGPGRRQQLSTTWPWNIRTSLLVLWGVCWMFYDSFRGLSRTAQNILLDDQFWDFWPTDEANWNCDAQAVDFVAQSPDGRAPSSSSLQAPKTGAGISEPPGFTAPQRPRQQGDESILSLDGQRQYGRRNNSSFSLYNNAYLPQNVSCSTFETATTSTWPDISGINLHDPNKEPSLDAWQIHDSQPYQQPLSRREGAPLLTLQGPDAEFSRVAPGIYSPPVLWDVQQDIFSEVNGTEYDLSMPDSEIYPSPDSEASGQLLHSRKPSLDGSCIMMTSSNADQTSPISVGTVGRAGLSLKRDQEPPRTEEGQITCSHLDCSRNRPPTFLRKCEWSKHMDKHDRPYICTEHGCEKIRGFTYSGGLLRHQREVHKKNGGPKAPLMCPHRDCKRSTGVGFTRKENLVEHCRRVHRKDASYAAPVHEPKGEEDDEGEGGSPMMTMRKRKRCLTGSDTKNQAHTAILENGGGDLRDQVKRLKQESEEKDKRLRDLEASVASLREQMHRHSS